jgi:hypothetical protein
MQLDIQWQQKLRFRAPVWSPTQLKTETKIVIEFMGKKLFGYERERI